MEDFSNGLVVNPGGVVHSADFVAALGSQTDVSTSGICDALGH